MRTIFRTRVLLALVASAAFTIGCSGGEPGDESRPPTEPPAPLRYSVTLDSDLDSLDVGASKALAAQVRDSKGGLAAVAPEWSTVDATIATVSPIGVISAIAPGSTKVIAKVTGGADTATVVVRDGSFLLHLQPSAASLAEGDGLALQAKVVTVNSGQAAAAMQFRWETSDANVALVDDDGNVTTIAPGEATITATAGSLSATAAVNVRGNQVASVTLAPANSTLYPGETLALQATAFNGDNKRVRNKTATFTSSNPAAATVNAAGQVTAVAKGIAVITADIEGVTSSATVNVLDAAAASVSVALSSGTISSGQSTQATATVRDASGNPLTGKSIAWQSSNPSIATVNSAGQVTGITNGSAEIRAVVDAKIGGAPLTVAPSVATSISITPGSASVQAGQTAQLGGQVKDQNGNVMNGQSITWSSSNPGVASVSASGLVTGVAGGNAMITARSGTLSANASVAVSAVPVASVAITPTYTEVAQGQSYQFSAIAKDGSGNPLHGRVATWTSSDPAIATVDANGTVTAKAAGDVEIRATIEGQSGRAEALVTTASIPVASISLSANSTSLTVGQSTQLVATLRDANGNVLSGRTIAWASQNPALATVNGSGLVSAIGAGSATITASADGQVGAFTIAISAAAPAPVASITVSANASTLTVGQTTQLVVTLRDANGNVLTGRSLAYGVDNPVAASVSASGLVSALAVGEATVSVSSEGKTAATHIAVQSQQTTPTVAAVTVSLAASSITVGQGTQATATALSSNGQAIAGKSASWSVTSGLLYASVNSSGMVTGIAAGTSVVRAVIDGVAGTASVTVNAVVSTPPPSNLPQDLAVRATLPQATVQIPPMPTSGRTIRVSSGMNLQTVLDTARRNDIILLAAGATFTGEFKLKAKGGTAADGWIVIMSEGSLPSPGTRVTPAMASNFAKIRTPTAMAAIEATKGASGYRLIGLDIGANTSVTDNYGLVVLDAPYAVSSLGDIPGDMIIERSYIHGHSQMSVSRCVSLQSARSAVIDSYLGQCHAKDRDSQAIGGWSGPGPYLIENNYLEGSGENVMFGGADPAVQNVTPSDIVIRGNHFFKPLTWQGRVWLVKNLLELKHAQRVLIENNVFQNNWGDGQDGRAFVWQSINQNGGWGAWSVVRDITFRYNRVDNVAGVFNLADRYDGTETQGARFTIEHNVFTNVGNLPGTVGVFLIQGALADVRIEHNTGFGKSTSGAYLQFAHSSPLPRFTFRDNIGGGAAYDMNSPLANGKDMLTAYNIPAGNFTGNVMVTPYPQYMPANNLYTSSVSGVGFVSPSGFSGDWSLGSSSGFRGKASDGTDPGLNFVVVRNATSSTLSAAIVSR